MTAPGRVLRLELPGDFLHRSKLEQTILLAPFMVELEEALAALDLSLQYAFGFDFARVADLTVGDLLAIEPGLKRSEALVFELRNVPGDEQKAIVRAVLKRVQSRLVGAAFDATGMGWTVAEDMGREFGVRRGFEEGAGLVMALKLAGMVSPADAPLKTAFEDDALAIFRGFGDAGRSAHPSASSEASRVCSRFARVRRASAGMATTALRWRWRAGPAGCARWVEYGYTPAPGPLPPRRRAGLMTWMTAPITARRLGFASVEACSDGPHPAVPWTPTAGP